MKSVKIDFIGIGSQKAGTTWLHSNLMKLPQINFPLRKEIHYFDRSDKYPSPDRLSEPILMKRLLKPKWFKRALLEILKSLITMNFKQLKWDLKYNLGYFDNEWYISIFKPFLGIKGEITPSYSILEPEDIEEMHNLAPDAKLILMLRDPIERAWSHFRFSGKVYSDKSHHSYLEHITRFIDSPAQEKRSDIISTIRNYSAIYPREQILIGFYDAITESPEELMKNILNFIGAETDDLHKYCDLSQKKNVSRSEDCPAEIKKYLKEKYYNQIHELATNYGGYFDVWLNKHYNEKILNEKNENLSSFTLAN